MVLWQWYAVVLCGCMRFVLGQHVNWKYFLSSYADAGCIMVLFRWYAVVLCGCMRYVLGRHVNSNFSLSSKNLYAKFSNGQGVNTFSIPRKIQKKSSAGKSAVRPSDNKFLKNLTSLLFINWCMDTSNILRPINFWLIWLYIRGQKCYLRWYLCDLLKITCD